MMGVIITALIMNVLLILKTNIVVHGEQGVEMMLDLDLEGGFNIVAEKAQNVMVNLVILVIGAIGFLLKNVTPVKYVIPLL